MAIIEVFSKRNKLLKKGIGIEPIKNTDESKLIIIILVYSAMKIRAKVPLLYSVLNPETSSDSPSAKSKGDRFVSAKAVANQIKKEGKIRTRGQDNWFILIKLISNEISKSIAPNRIKAILTS